MLKHLIPLASMKVSGRSMLPSFSPDERVVVNRAAYWMRKPQQGDVVVLRHPESHIPLIKRVVAGPRERVLLREGHFYVNGRRIEGPYLTQAAFGKDEQASWLVPHQRYFVLGDNPYASTDSRHFGSVHQRRIIGKVLGTLPQE